MTTSPTPIRVLTETEIRRCAGLDAGSLAAVEQAFAWLSEGRVAMPPIMHIDVAEHAGDVDIKSAFVAGQPSIAVKVAAGYFGNSKLGLPSSSGLMVVLDARTGRGEAILLDNGYLTDLRTGLAGAVAAKWLAPPGPAAVGVVGAGIQARFQLQALALVRPISSVRVFARSREQALLYGQEMEEALGVSVEIAQDIRSLMADSTVILTTTPSREPLITTEWLRDGQHITAMGSDLPGKQELDPGILTRADLLVCDKPDQCRTHGELQYIADPLALRAPPVALGDIARGLAQGRADAGQITVCDLVGLGVQDTAIALHVLKTARSLGLGTLF
jgi:ectoine utilization protein EutC